MAVKLDLDDIQGLIARGYRTLPHARFTIFAAPSAAAGHALLSWLLPRVTPAGRFASSSALHVAYTAALPAAGPAREHHRRVFSPVHQRHDRPGPEPLSW